MPLCQVRHLALLSLSRKYTTTTTRSGKKTVAAIFSSPLLFIIGSSFAVYAEICVATNVLIFLSDSSCMPHSFSHCRNCRNLLYESAKSALMASAVPGHGVPVPRPTPIRVCLARQVPSSSDQLPPATAHLSLRHTSQVEHHAVQTTAYGLCCGWHSRREL